MLSRLTVDVYAALDVHYHFLSDDYLVELTDVRGRVRETLVLVAVDEAGTVLGGITYVDRPGRWSSIDRPDQVELRMLAVTPEAQGQGVGSGLVQACIDRARLDGRREVSLHTTSFMETAQRIYQRAGFHRRPDRDLAVEGGIVLIAYALDLDG